MRNLVDRERCMEAGELHRPAAATCLCRRAPHTSADRRGDP
jgi:hypothetical protein